MEVRYGCEHSLPTEGFSSNEQELNCLSQLLLSLVVSYHLFLSDGTVIQGLHLVQFSLLVIQFFLRTVQLSRSYLQPSFLYH